MIAAIVVGGAVAGVTIGSLAAFGGLEGSLASSVVTGTADLQVGLSVGGVNEAAPHGLLDLPIDGSTATLTAQNVAPGDIAVATVSLHLKGDPLVEPARPITLIMSRSDDLDVSCNEPEGLAETPAAPGCDPDGELDDRSLMLIWYDYGTDGQISVTPDADGTEGNNQLDAGEVIIYGDSGTGAGLPAAGAAPLAPGAPVEIPLDADTTTPAVSEFFVPAFTYYIGVLWEFPDSGDLSDNEAQSDTFKMDYSFAIVDGVTAASVTVNAPATVSNGGSFSARVNVTEVTDFDTALFDVIYDPSVLSIADITPGIGVTDGDLGGTIIPIAGTNQIAPGVVRVLVNVSGSPGVTGAGFLADIHFDAVGTGVSAIDLANVLLGDNAAQEIASSFQGATVTVN